MHRMINTDTVAYSWYDSSSREYFEDCEGDEMLGWKDKGYGTVLELLQVFLHFYCFRSLLFGFFQQKNHFIFRIKFPAVTNRYQ